MEKDRCTTGRTQLNALSTAAAFALCFMSAVPVLYAQDAPKTEAKPDTVKQESPKPVAARIPDTRPMQTFFLSHALQQNDGAEVLTELRLMLDPSAKLYLVPSQNAIVVRADANDMALAKKLIEEMDRPRKSWRLTYTIVESDAGKKIGVQHTALVVMEGGRTVVKDGSKIPIATGTDTHSTTQFTYVDVGLNIDASLDGVGMGARLRSKIEQSSAVESKTIAGVTEPVIRQNVTEGTVMLMPGKPITLGSMDIAGSTRHLDIEVVMEPVL